MHDLSRDLDYKTHSNRLHKSKLFFDHSLTLSNYLLKVAYTFKLSYNI